MPIPRQPSRSLLLLALAGALNLSACSDKSADAPPQAAEASAEAQLTAADSAAQAPKHDYWKTLAPMVAGSYEGSCLSQPSLKMAPGQVQIGADGKVSAGAFKGDLRTAGDVHLNRVRDENGVFSTTMISGGNDFMLSLMVRGTADGDAVSVMQGQQGLVCEKAKDLKAFSSASLYSRFASKLDRPARKVRCLMLGEATFNDADFQISKGVLKLRDMRFTLSELTQEIVILSDELSGLSYAGSLADETGFTLILDAQGEVKHIQVKGKKDAAYACTGE